MLVDTHVHLHFDAFDADRDEVMERAVRAGVGYFIEVGTDVTHSRQALEYARRFKNVYATAGIHPHEAGTASAADLKAIEDLLKDPKVVALGEIGLDFFRDHSSVESQERVFELLLDIYERSGKPLVIHCRDAFDRLHEMLAARKKNYRGVMHCFSGDAAVMQRFVALGFHISFAGPLTYKKNDGLREACRTCPKDRLLLETDAPYLPPQTMRGKRNESAYMVETAETAAKLHGVDLPELAAMIYRNANQLFGIKK
ncbi:MAG: hypothetical protein A2Z83_06200 [Omnitrophica bacterium GWA2_52_8]|nr:MAG: hypothetical protein A2Z83_06200 [Omnitrophica bacterium GWA2_52_8]